MLTCVGALLGSLLEHAEMTVNTCTNVHEGSENCGFAFEIH